MAGALFEAVGDGRETRVYVFMLEGPDSGRGLLGCGLGVLGDLVPGLADSGVFEERCHCGGDCNGLSHWRAFKSIQDMRLWYVFVEHSDSLNLDRQGVGSESCG